MDLQGTGSPPIEVPASEHSSTVKKFGVTALALFLYLLLADVAIETFWSGAPVRWWVLGVVTVSLVGVLVAWRSAPTIWKRMTPAVLATSGAGVFLVLLAATVWLPGGLDNGVRLAGQPTSVVLALLSTCAVILAGTVVLRLRAVPLWARLALTALAAYACAGFVVGLLRSTPFLDLFHGLGFWSRLPVWLQGPRLGAFVVLPLGAIALALTWLKHRGEARTSTSTLQPSMLLLAAFAASLAAVSAAGGANPPGVAPGTVDLANRSSLPAAPLSPEQKQQAYKTEVSALRDRVARLQTSVDSFPKALVEVDALSGTLAAPEAAFAFVRDQIALEPYSGVMKGAAGTLVTRGGNALDRALLLARILGRNGIATRIARGQLPAPQAPILLQQIASSSDAVGLIARSLGNARPASRLSDRDRQSADSLRLQAEGRAKTARAAADQGYGALKASLEKAGLPILRDTGPDQLKILQDHFWVKATIAGQTIDLDPSVADARMAQPATYRGQAFSADDLAGPQQPPELVNYFFYSSLAHHFIAAKEAPGVRQFNLRPRLAFFRHGFAVHDWSRPTVSRRYQEGLDVVNVLYGFVGPREASATLGLKIGVADTSLERSFARSGIDFNTVPLVASAGNQKIALTTAGPGQASTIDALPLPVAIKAVLRDELAEGRTLVLPASLVTLNQVRSYGWWSIDPESGVALGKMDLGAGQGLVEHSKLSEKMLEMSHIFAKCYGGVLGCFMVEIADQLVPPDGPYHVLSFPGLPKIEGGKDLGTCIASKACEAIVELAILAASSAAYHEEAEEMIQVLLDLVNKTLIAEGAAEHSCAGLEGGEHSAERRGAG